jgi:predicted DNA binding CopG/RHH family protein
VGRSREEVRMKKKRLTDPSQVPSHMSDKEEAEFWSTHEVTKEYLDKVEGTDSEDLPPPSKSISVRFDEDTLQRLKKLATNKGKRYQTLLKEFVVERLYEEEQKQQQWASSKIGWELHPNVLWSGSTGHVEQAPEVEFSNEYMLFNNPRHTTKWTLRCRRSFALDNASDADVVIVVNDSGSSVTAETVVSSLAHYGAVIDYDKSIIHGTR